MKKFIDKIKGIFKGKKQQKQKTSIKYSTKLNSKEKIALLEQLSNLLNS
jgi:hypothetical protein